MSKSQFDLAGLTFQRQEWCSLGAYTRIARYETLGRFRPVL
jgi:hypothetical protein